MQASTHDMKSAGEYIRFSFTFPGADLKELFIALLSDIGFSGFEEDGDRLTGYVAANAFNRKAFDNIIKTYSGQFTYEEGVIPVQNWNALWEKHFHPVNVGGKVCVRAPFHMPGSGVLYDIIIHPAMAFGTGHHPTTYMMMEKMLEIPMEGKDVLDFGCGTGVLAILAEKSGAKSVDAVEIDPVAVESACHNLALNQSEVIRLYEGDANAIPGKTYDVILANIQLNPLIESLPVLVKHLKTNGIMLWSGILANQREQVVPLLTKSGFDVEITSRDGWMCLYIFTGNQKEL